MKLTAVGQDSVIHDPQFPELLDFVLSTTGLVYYADRTPALAAHIAQRLRARELSDCGDYLRLLQNERTGETELDRLVELLTIGETYFFRHRELFDALRDRVLPEIIDRNRASRRLRIWSAGCAGGAETYSLSILLRRELARLTAGWRVTLIGTDVNRQFLAQAAEGRYEEWAFRGTPPALREDCFERDGSAWRIASRFQEDVTFKYHNLARHPYPSLPHNLLAFDLVLCRNVLIYFGGEFVERVIGQLAECLSAGGWLGLGHAETGSRTPSSLEVVQVPGAVLFRKTIPQPKSAATTSATAFSLDEPPPANANGTAALSSAPPTAPLPANGAPRPGTSPQFAEVRTLADQGQVDAALELCAGIAATHGLNPVYHFYQGLLLDQAGAAAPARQCLQRAIYLDRNFALAHYYLGLAHRQAGDAADAARSFRNVERLLAERDSAEPTPEGDGLTVADLRAMAATQLESGESA